MSSTPHALMAGGGTGGHVFPGLAVAAELHELGWRSSWAGRAGEMEERLVAGAGLDFHPLPARAVVGRGPAAKAAALWTLARSALAARRLLKALGIQVVLGTGGYVSVPAVLGARLAARPVVLLEPNGRAGAANRSLSRFAAAAAIAYETARPDFRCPVRLTGVPVRPAFFEIPPPPGDGPRVLVLGGSQGALKLNLLLPAVFERLAAEFPRLEVVHQAGRHEEATRAAYGELSLPGSSVEIVPFIDDVAAAMGRSNLIVSRAGAVTLAEICAAGRPALLIPLELAGGHQRDNALALADAGGARLLAESASIDEAVAALRPLLAGEELRREMGEALTGLAHRDAAREIADLMTAAAEERAR